LSFFKKIFTPKDVEDRAALSKKVQTMPQDPQARQKLGLWLLQHGEIVEGIDQLARSAVLYEKSGFTGKAIAVLRHMIKQDPGNVELLRWLIRMLAQQGHAGDAQRELERVAGGAVRFTTDDQKIEFFRQASESLPKNPLPHLLITDILIANRKYYEALNELDKAAGGVVAFGMGPEFAKRMMAFASRAGDNAELVEMSGLVWLRAGRVDDALQLLTRSQVLFRKSGDSHRAGETDEVLAAIRAGRGNDVAGAKTVAEAVRILSAPPPPPPPAPVPPPETLRVEAAPGPTKESPPPAAPPETDRVEEEQTAQAAPGPARRTGPAAPLSSEEDKIVQSVVEKLQAKVNEEIGDSDPEARYNLGIAYKEMGLLDEAMGEFRVARGRRSLFLGASILLAETMADKNDFDGALATIDELLASDLVGGNETRDVQYQKALLLDRAGRDREGNEIFRALFEKWPEYRDVRARVERPGR
jgi:tetratricopeptide (TPR) repeat protein